MFPSTTTANMSDDDELKISPRSYQVEIVEQAKRENLIVCLPTGSGKTFIAIMLIKEWSLALRRPLEDQAGKRTVLLVKTVELARQHLDMMTKHLDLKIKVYDGSSQIDLQNQQRWNQELATNQVLIFTAQKFINLLDHNVFSLDRVNLLIFDECHHASGDDHYSLVMKKHYYSSQQPPRVLGLTASISGQKIEPQQLRKTAADLEHLYRARIETGSDQTEINRNSTSVTTTRVRCVPYEKSMAKNGKPIVIMLNRIKALVDELEKSSNVKKNKMEFEETSFGNNDQLAFVRLQCRTLAQLKSQLDNILHIGRDLGLYGLCLGVKALRSHLHSINLSRNMNNTLDVDLYEKTIRELDTLIPEEYQSLNLNRTILFSEKVLKCEEYLRKNISGQSIIFVERVYTAAFLCQVLRKLFEDSPIRMKYLAASKAHIDGITVSPKYQREVASEFRQHDIHVLISTAIVEEGLDVPGCNLVIRFNKPQNFASYMQSKGRARAKNGSASFVLLMDEADIEAFSKTKQEYEDYELMEKMLKRNFKSDIDAETSSNESLSSLQLYEPGQGVKIDAIRAVEIVYQYCMVLGNGQVLSPRFVFDTTIYQIFKCTLSMPGNCPCREDVICANKNKKQAKQECCLKMVEILHKKGELDQRCLPIRPDRDLTSGDSSENEEQDQVSAETIDNQFAYFPYKHTSPSAEWYLYEIVLYNSADLGFVTPFKLVGLPSFTLYGRDDTVPVTITCLKCIDFKQYEKQLQNFCQYLFEEVFDDMNTRGESIPISFDMERSTYKLLPCFLTDDGDIDCQRMARICSRGDQSIGNPSELEESELYYSLTSSKRSFHTCVCDISLARRAGDQFVHKKPIEEIKTYADYCEYKLPQIQIRRDNLMATMKDYRKPRINYLKNYVSKKDKELNSASVIYNYFPIEVLRYAPLNQADLQLIYKLPTILVRLSQLFHIQQLKELLPHHTTTRVIDPIQVVTFGDCLTSIFQPTYSKVLPLISFNYASLSQHHQRLQPSFDLLFQATTRRSADENTDMENLEILGDCFLKLAMSMALFHQYPLDNVGKLTAKKDNKVSNKNLHRLAMEKKLQNYLNANKPLFSGKDANWTPPGYAPNDDTLDRYTKQDVRYKAFADMIEALIGAFLISTNYSTTLSFMQWVGLDVIPKNEHNEVMRTPSSLCAGLDDTMGDVMKKIDEMFVNRAFIEIESTIKYTFKNKAYLIAAFTHPSYVDNNLTQSYERLEYLGDAVLDFLVMRCVFLEHYDKVTPSRITDIRQDLSNNGRLAYLFVSCDLHKKVIYASTDLFDQINSYIRDEPLFSSNQPMKTKLSKDIDQWADSTAPKALADVFEALIGAIFLDSGYSLDAVWKMIEPLLRQYINRSVEHPNLNPVRAFYEHGGKIDYESTDENGKYICIAKLPNGSEFKGRGKKKKLAIYDACRKASTTY